jgi:NTP pyrophosphatase (non-canonical NTP hydrolase)
MTLINQIGEADIIELEAYGFLNQYASAATKSASYPGKGNPLGLNYCALKLNGEAGELAEHVGKAMCDDGMLDFGPNIPGIGFVCRPLTQNRRIKLVKEVGDCLWYLAAICNELGITLQDAAATNLKKIRQRQLDGTQQGEGDDR